MVFLLKAKTSKKDVPIDRLPFMISEKTDCLGSRFFRITTYYLLPLRISFSTLSTCCRCTFQFVLLLHTSHYPAHFTLLCPCAFHFPCVLPAAPTHFSLFCYCTLHLILHISIHWPPAANIGRISCSQAASQPPHMRLTAVRHFITPNSIRNFLSQFYNFYAFNNGLVRLQDAKWILIFERTKD